jgi:L,D-transpeptidase catalytic domain
VGRQLKVLVSTLCVATAAPASAAAMVSVDGWTRVYPKPAPHVIAYVRPGASVAVHARPFGPVLERLGARTEFGSARAFGVATTRHDRWLGVTAPGVGNNRLVWVDARAGGLRFSHTRLELDVDLSSRTLVVRRDGSAVRRFSVGVGRPGSPTPSGRFAVTDKLAGRAYSAVYGCCILALSATQPSLPAGWRGGNRIAIHGTLSPSDFGRAVSAGCVHASETNLRYLMRRVPLGTPVVIRP